MQSAQRRQLLSVDEGKLHAFARCRNPEVGTAQYFLAERLRPLQLRLPGRLQVRDPRTEPPNLRFQLPDKNERIPQGLGQEPRGSSHVPEALPQIPPWLRVFRVARQVRTERDSGPVRYNAEVLATQVLGCVGGGANGRGPRPRPTPAHVVIITWLGHAWDMVLGKSSNGTHRRKVAHLSDASKRPDPPAGPPPGSPAPSGGSLK